MTPDRLHTAEEWEIRCRDLQQENTSLTWAVRFWIETAERKDREARDARRALRRLRTEFVKSPTPPSGGGPARGARGRDTSPPAPAQQHDSDAVNAAWWAAALAASAVFGLGLWKAGELIAGVIA